jgi:nucleotide-binding universal stress UspA family protein
MTSAPDISNLVVVSTDFSDCGDLAIPHAFRIANDRGARVAMVHVLDAHPIPNPLYAHYYPTPTLDQIRQAEEKAEEGLLARVPPEHHGSDRTEILVTHGVPSAEIVRIAAERNASLIVIATHGRRGLVRLALGSVADRVVREAPCPVLVVR